MTTSTWLEEMFADNAVAEPKTAEQIEFDRKIAQMEAEHAIHLAQRAQKPNCPKCAGTGRLPYFSHIKGGECFKCGGSGYFFKA